MCVFRFASPPFHYPPLDDDLEVELVVRQHGLPFLQLVKRVLLARLVRVLRLLLPGRLDERVKELADDLQHVAVAVADEVERHRNLSDPHLVLVVVVEAREEPVVRRRVQVRHALHHHQIEVLPRHVPPVERELVHRLDELFVPHAPPEQQPGQLLERDPLHVEPQHPRFELPRHRLLGGGGKRY